MPHGLTEAAATVLLSQDRPVWVRNLATSGKSQVPMRLVRLAGNYGELMNAKGPPNLKRVLLSKIEICKAPNLAAMQRRAPPLSQKEPAMMTIIDSDGPAAETAAPIVQPPVPEVKPLNPREKATAIQKAREASMFVLYDPETKSFYTHKHKWARELALAHCYSFNVANKARGRLMGKDGKCRDKVIDSMTYEEAEKLISDRTGVQITEPTPEAVVLAKVAPPTQAPPLPGPGAIPVALAPIYEHTGLQTALSALSKARTDEAAAAALAADAHRARIEAEAHFEIALARARCGLP